MSNEIILMLHPAFGVLAMIAAVWVYVETLNASEANEERIRTVSKAMAVFMWLAYLIGGYWYIVYYGGDKAIIKAGPWPFSHGFFMETKEHLFLMLLLLATFVPIATTGNIVRNAGTRAVVLWTSALTVLMALAIEGAGAFISMGVKVALLPK